MYRFLVIVEQTDGNYSAYSPDLPGGCVATGGATREEAEERMHEAIEFHIEGGLREDGLPIPPSRSSAIYVAVGRG
ncbi:type II toxin-antitoxin system HicB family antitoxin [Methanoculleus chikugoensis]|uniref:type II toxin-antitoxin system HicB family antitoxin n=1 Tax=Methanoculleus chikugoensis TaxID=118126 RepID=UPI0006CFF78B|nr:type II toxin-antitoxin system HicB family antitoxin [Methanoculleus chikugoensis]